MKTKINILHLEDNKYDAELISFALEDAGIESVIEVVDTRDDFINNLKSEKYDLIMSDFSLKSFNGMEALNISREMYPDIPFIFISGTIGEERAVESLLRGAKDYVLKNKLSRLIPAIKRIMDEIEQVREKKSIENRLKLVVKATNDIIWDWDITKEEIHWGETKSEHLGYKFHNENHHLQWWEEKVHPEDRERVSQSVAEAINGNDEHWHDEYRFLKNDGSFAYIIDRGYIIRDRDGKAVRMVGAMTDITDRKKAELEMINAKEKAEEMSRLKSNFLANMSHELRTPMVGINGFSKLLMRELDDPDLHEMAQAIYNSGVRLTKTLNLILDLSKIESDKMELSLTEVNLVTLVVSASEIFYGVAGLKQLSFHVITHDEKVCAKIDESLFNSVIDNLLNNAFKFTDEGSILVEVGYEYASGNKFATVKIKDTGIGISNDMLEVIFNEFRQVSEGTGRNFEGSGLGLTVTKKLVEIMRGKILVDSEIGKGSTFTLRFPAIETPDEKGETALPEHETDPEKNSGQKSGKQMPTVLIVEDDNTNKLYAEKVLRKHVLLEHVKSGAEAIIKAGKKMYDVILMDINLGEGLTGIETVREIRKINGYTNVPIVAVTAYAFNEDKEEFLANGCDFYLSKPYSPDQMLNLMAKIGVI